MPCLRRFSFAFRGSHSNLTLDYRPRIRYVSIPLVREYSSAQRIPGNTLCRNKRARHHLSRSTEFPWKTLSLFHISPGFPVFVVQNDFGNPSQLEILPLDAVPFAVNDLQIPLVMLFTIGKYNFSSGIALWKH